MDVFLQSETNSFVEMLFKVVETKEYANTTPLKEEAKDDAEVAKAEEEQTEPKIEADSTTPIREYEKYPDTRPSSYDGGRVSGYFSYSLMGVVESASILGSVCSSSALAGSESSLVSSLTGVAFAYSLVSTTLKSIST